MKIDLSTQDGFDIASGIRGADVVPVDGHGAMVVKWILTSRLRGLVHDCDKSIFGAMIRKTPNLIEVEQLSPSVYLCFETFVGGIHDVPFHYLSHTRDAFHALAKLLPDGAKRDEAEALCRLSAIAVQCWHVESPDADEALREQWDELFGGKDEH